MYMLDIFRVMPAHKTLLATSGYSWLVRTNFNIERENGARSVKRAADTRTALEHSFSPGLCCQRFDLLCSHCTFCRLIL